MKCFGFFGDVSDGSIALCNGVIECNGFDFTFERFGKSFSSGDFFHDWLDLLANSTANRHDLAKGHW